MATCLTPFPCSRLNNQNKTKLKIKTKKENQNQITKMACNSPAPVTHNLSHNLHGLTNLKAVRHAVAQLDT